MSDDKYSIDDILKEIDTHRSSDGDGKKPSYDGSVTDIIGGSELDQAVRTGTQVKRTDNGEKPDISVTAVINSIAAKKNKEPVKSSSRTAKQRTDAEVNRRVADDIADAMEKNVKKAPMEDVVLSARQRTEEEVNERIAKEISEAADIKIWERLREDDSEMDEEGVRTYTPQSAEEDEVREYSGDEDDDIVFQDPDSFVTTNTSQLRKLSKIEEINQALLKVDSEADDPDDMLASLNPMETRAKATEQIKNDDENTDTLAVGGNDLKRIASRGDEKIKEYRPSAARKKEPENKAEDVLFSATGVQRAAFPGGLHVGESIVDALNKKIREEKEDEMKAGEKPAPAESTENTQSGKINVIASAPDEPEEQPEDEQSEKIKQANELAQKKKRKIANFILEDMGSDTEELERSESYDDDEESDDEPEEAVDLDDE
ncbi:MAG: hypothetical protein K2N38_11405, partial [Oscillospiraceae bacterium]|nr:hypothetical protein [Oscillospiraceae bacterium]